MTTKPLIGKVAVVAGSTRGAGRGIACMLGEAGATVYCTGRSVRGNLPNEKRPETIDDTARLVTEHGGEGIAVRADHTVPAQVQALFERVASEKARLDILVNNANGDDLLEWKAFWELSLDNGFRSMERGVNTHLITTHAALPLMLKRKGGLIAGITDEGGGTFFYGFVKQSVMRTAELLAPELIPHGITAVSVTPGFLRSEAVLEHYGVRESNWRDAIGQDPYFAASETPFFVGRGIAALAADPRAILKAGMLLRSGELAAEYGFTDIDGTRPNLRAAWKPLMDEGWRKITLRVRAEFEKHGVDPSSVLEEDRENLTLRVRLSLEPPLWLKEVVGPAGVAFGDPEKIAEALYNRYEELR
jgi:NAD(P)-dependent dehydrogenase (short-subunit alcohol dehydrogenase family)